MKENDIKIVIEDKNGKKLNPIFAASSTVLKEKYNIDIEKIQTQNKTKEADGR